MDENKIIVWCWFCKSWCADWKYNKITTIITQRDRNTDYAKAYKSGREKIIIIWNKFY